MSLIGPPLRRYALLAFELNHMLDRGLHLDPEETSARLSDGTFFDWIAEQFPDEDDWRPDFFPEQAERDEMTEELCQVCENADARRSFGVQWNGIALVLAYSIQIMRESGTPATETRSP